MKQLIYSRRMDITALLKSIEEEIARLQQARALLAGTNSPRRRGRPPGSSNKQKPTLVKKRTISAAGRKRIAEAQRARWAKQKKQAA
jgi:hypothetical protein